MACLACSQPLPEEARFCPFCGHQVVATPNEERRLITVLFADVVGYTGLVEYLDPERAKRLIDDAFKRLIADVIEFGGSIDKVLGDGILALFGAPIAHEDDPDRAVRAALQLHSSLAQFVVEHPELTQPVQLRVGVNTGEVLFGRLAGTDDYTVMGDVVNVAARLQALAPPGEVYVGDSTAALTSSAISLAEVDDLAVRGRQQTERVWRAMGLEHVGTELRVNRDTPFVGRARQQKVLADVIDDLRAGRGALVSIVGEAGSGKTRLIAEALGASVVTNIAVLAGVCAPFGETNPWAPLGQAMLGRIDATTTLSPTLMRDLSIERAITEYGFDAEDPRLSWLAEGALHLAGHPSTFDDMPRARARDTLTRLIVDALRRRSADAPLILSIDDVQWADPLLVDVLHRISRSLADRAFLLVTAQRDDADVDWPPRSDVVDSVDIVLDPLTPVEADQLIAAVAGEPADGRFASQLYERSGGNPFFLTELASLDDPSLDRRELPSSLRVLIAARLDRLDPRARAIIDNAAVLGSEDGVASLETFAREIGQTFVRSDLLSLEEAGLLELFEPGRWRFRSDVVREVAYETLTKGARAERHAGVASVMMSIASVPVSRVAHHAASAVELDREIGPIAAVPSTMSSVATELLLRSGQRALEIGAFQQARADADRALAIGADDSSLERKLRLVRAAGATELREFDAASKDGRVALESALAAGDRYDEGVSRRLLGNQAHGLGDLPTARTELDHSISIFRELDDDAGLAISLADRGYCEIFGGSLDRADVLLDEAHALATTLGDLRSIAWAGEHKALVAFLSGDLELAAQRLEIAIENFRELGDRSGLSWAQAIQAYLAYAERRLDDAEQLAGAARVEALKLGERWGPAMMDTLIASIRLWTGNFAEAEVLSRRSLETFRELGDRFGTVQSLAPNVRSLVALGRFAEAERGMEEALALSETSGSMALPAMVAAGTAVHLGVGDRSVVIGQLAFDRILETGSDGSEVRTALALALCQAGRADEALGYLVDTTIDKPYTRSVQALALALVTDTQGALDQLQLVEDDLSATYLDRMIADLAGAAVHVGAGDVAAASTRLKAAVSAADSVGDAVAIAVTNAAFEQLVRGKADFAPPGLGPGWRRVIADLAQLYPLGSPVTVK